jgi:hypothetical protein
MKCFSASCTRVSESTIKINESQAHSPGAVITKKNFTIKHRYTIGSLGHLVSFAQHINPKNEEIGSDTKLLSA